MGDLLNHKRPHYKGRAGLKLRARTIASHARVNAQMVYIQ